MYSLKRIVLMSAWIWSLNDLKAKYEKIYLLKIRGLKWNYC